jgi:hypothetical protein
VRHLLDQAPPTVESLPARKVSVEHRAGAMPHLGKSARICAKAAQRAGKNLALAGLDDDAAFMPPDKPGDFPV